MALLPPTDDTPRAVRLRFINPGWGWCLRCGLPWTHTQHHTTNYGKDKLRGCFPLCKSCWTELGSPEARIEYYKMLIDSWELDKPVDPDQKKDIQLAVANGG